MYTGNALYGFIAAAAVGAGGGLALGSLGKNLAMQRVEASVQIPQDPRISVVRVRGTAKILGPDGKWNRAYPGDAYPRPMAVVTEGYGSELVLSYKKQYLVVAHDAKAFVSGPGTPIAVQLERGLVLFFGGQRSAKTYLPKEELIVSGPAYGVWENEGETKISVLGGEAEISLRGGSPSKFAKSRELLLTSEGLTPSVLSTRLNIETKKKLQRRGRTFRVTATTSPNAVVVQPAGEGFKEVSLSVSGGFSANVSSDPPEPGELVAFDSAGRRAELGKPSGTIDETIAAFSGQSTEAGRVAEQNAISDLSKKKGPKVDAPDPARRRTPPKSASTPKAEGTTKKPKARRTESRGSASPSVKLKTAPSGATKARSSSRKNQRGGDTPAGIRVDFDGSADVRPVGIEDKPEATAPTEEGLRKSRKKAAAEKAGDEKAKEDEPHEDKKPKVDSEDDGDLLKVD